MKILKLLLSDARIDVSQWFIYYDQSMALSEPELIKMLLDHPTVDFSQHLELIKGDTELSWHLMHHPKFLKMDVNEVWKIASESFRLELITDPRFPLHLISTEASDALNSIAMIRSNQIPDTSPSKDPLGLILRTALNFQNVKATGHLFGNWERMLAESSTQD